VLQCVAVCCSVLHCVALCCIVLHCVVYCCSVLQCTTLFPRSFPTNQSQTIGLVCIWQHVLQCVAVCVAPCVAVCCRSFRTNQPRTVGLVCVFSVCSSVLQGVLRCEGDFFFAQRAATNYMARSREGRSPCTTPRAIASYRKTPFFPTNEKGNAQGFH